jgi:molecular chaperone DnaK
MTVLIERNTTIPTTKKETFSTASDNQTAVTVRVFQGERQMAADNRLLQQFNLDGIPLAPRGQPQVEVAFDIDVNGILNVSAKDLKTGKEQSVQIEESSGLSDDEIERIRKEAESHADGDKKRREVAEAQNNGSRMVYDTEKLLKEHADKLDDASKSAVESSMEKVKEAVKGDDVERINTALAELTQAAQALSEHINQAAAPDAAPDGTEDSADDGSDTTEANADVIDAEFEKKE